MQTGRRRRTHVISFNSLFPKVAPGHVVFFTYEEQWQPMLFAARRRADYCTNSFHIIVSFASLLASHTYLVVFFASHFLVAYLDTSSRQLIFVRRRRIRPNCPIAVPWPQTAEQGPRPSYIWPIPINSFIIHRPRGLVSSMIVSACIFYLHLLCNSHLCP